MTDTPEKKVADPVKVNEASAVWFKAKRALVKAQEAEAAARATLVKEAFPNGLDEGTNTFALAGLFKLKVTGVIDRKIDVAALPSILARFKEKFPDLDAEGLVRYKPELETKEYRALVKKDPKAAKLFENALIIKGTDQTSPQVKIEEAKR